MTRILVIIFCAGVGCPYDDRNVLTAGEISAVAHSTERSIRKRLARQKELRKKQGVTQTENALYKKPKKLRGPKSYAVALDKSLLARHSSSLSASSESSPSYAGKSFLNSQSLEQEIHRSEVLVSKKKRRLEQFEVEKRKYEERKLMLEKLIQDRTATILRLKASKTSIENNVASLETEMQSTRSSSRVWRKKY